MLEEQRVAFNARTVGKTCDVLFDKPGRYPGQMVGRSPWLQAVVVNSPSIVSARLRACASMKCRAIPCSAPWWTRRPTPHERAQSGAARISGRPAARRRCADAAEIILSFEDNRLASKVFGLYDQNLAHLERRLGITANANGNHVVLKGAADHAERARRVLEELYARARAAKRLLRAMWTAQFRKSPCRAACFRRPRQPTGAQHFEQIATRKRGPVRARNAAQDVYLRALRRYELVFAEARPELARHGWQLVTRCRCWSRVWLTA